jgi:DNA-binding transcriptional ArsR family regulator
VRSVPVPTDIGTPHDTDHVDRPYRGGTEHVRLADLTAGELVGHFEISGPSVSRHLKVLETASHVTSQRHGGHIICSLTDSVLGDIATEGRRHREDRPPTAYRQTAITADSTGHPQQA